MAFVVSFQTFGVSVFEAGKRTDRCHQSLSWHLLCLCPSGLIVDEVWKSCSFGVTDHPVRRIRTSIVLFSRSKNLQGAVEDTAK